MPALPLTPEQKADAARLKEAYNSWKAREKAEHRPANQAHIAGLLGIQQSAFSQYCNGDIPLNVAILLKLKKAVGFEPESISPSLTQEMARLASAVDTNEEKDHVPIKMMDAKASAGRGELVFSDDVNKMLMFRRDYLTRHHAKPSDVFAFAVKGSSMVDMHIVDGAVILANSKNNEPIPGRVYVMRLGGKLYVKELIQNEGRLVARSHNKESIKNYPDLEIGPDDRIIGRAFWCGFGL